MNTKTITKINEFFDKMISINADPNKELDVVDIGICKDLENYGCEMVDVTIDGKTVRMYVEPEY